MQERFLRVLLPLLAAAAFGACAVAVAAPTAPSKGTRASRPAQAAPAHRAPVSHPAPSAIHQPSADTPTATALAAQARAAEDEGLYPKTLAILRALRTRTSPDADLELALALEEARTGEPDSAWARLNSPLLSAAMLDTLPAARWLVLGPGRELLWLDGRFDGWHWYIARARAEVALRLGRWNEAEAAAKIAVHARPLSGRDHLLLAVAAGRAGDDALARREADAAALLEPTLPEALDLSGLWAWRAGNRNDARSAFEAAIARDPTDRDAALALVRLRLPSAPPDSLPRRFLRGVRRAGMLTSSEGPKVEETLASDQLPGLFGVPVVTAPDSVKRNPTFDAAMHLEATVLVDEAGHAQLADFPYYSPAHMPPGLMNAMMLAAERWKFRPALRLGHELRMWINVEIALNP